MIYNTINNQLFLRANQLQKNFILVLILIKINAVAQIKSTTINSNRIIPSTSMARTYYTGPAIPAIAPCQASTIAPCVVNGITTTASGSYAIPYTAGNASCTGTSAYIGCGAASWPYQGNGYLTYTFSQPVTRADISYSIFDSIYDYGYIKTNSCGPTLLSNTCGIAIGGTYADGVMITGSFTGTGFRNGNVKLTVSSAPDKPFTTITFKDDISSLTLIEQGNLCTFNLTPFICGGTAPNLSSSTRTIICSEGSANLSNITANNTPVGALPCANYLLTWHTSSVATSANRISTITTVTAGNYYASFYNSVTGCYSPTSLVVVNAPAGACEIVISPKVMGGFFCYRNTSQTSTFSIFDLSQSGTGFAATIGGVPCTAANTIISVAETGPFSINPDGTTTILQNILPFYSRLNLTICPRATPGQNCVPQLVDIGIWNIMNPGKDFTVINTTGTFCTTCQFNVPINVLTNDLILDCNGVNPYPATTANCIVTQLTGPPYNSYPFLSIASNGDIVTATIVPIPIGLFPVNETPYYELTYKICDIAYPIICKEATLKVAVSNSFKMANTRIKTDQNNFDINKVTILPNPSNGIFTLSFNDYLNGAVTIEIYNILGLKVQEHAFTNATNYDMIVNNLQAGTYIIKLSVDDETVTKKIIIL